jgi:hypothetical protein
MSTLKDWLVTVSELGDNPLRFATPLEELGYMTPEGILAAGDAEILSKDTGIPLGAARIIMKAAGGDTYILVLILLMPATAVLIPRCGRWEQYLCSPCSFSVKDYVSLPLHLG